MPMRLRSGRSLEAEIPRKRTRFIKGPKTSWFDLPFEMREMIIDEMDAETRCRFARCSKLCEKEAKESKNYLHTIHVSMKPFKSVKFCYTGDEISQKSHRVYFRSIHSESLELNRGDAEVLVDGDLDETFANFVLENVKKYRKSLQFLKIVGHDYNSYLPKINVNMFRKLERIEIDFDNDASIPNSEEVRRAQFVYLNRLKIDQYMKFEGIGAVISSDQMDRKYARKYLKMLKNGEVHQNVKRMIISIKYRKNVNIGNVIYNLHAPVGSTSKCNFEVSGPEENRIRNMFVSYQPFLALFVSAEK